MPPKKMHEILIDLLEADTAIFLADRPTVLELARFIDGLAQVQAALEKVRTIACREFVDRLERANNESAPHTLGCQAEGAIDLRFISGARKSIARTADGPRADGLAPATHRREE